MKLFAKLKNDKKGFTLVEMIVVIVIIGILLAILVPGMFKYIDKAKDKQIQVNARTACLNIEEAVATVYGKNGVTGEMIETWFDNKISTIDVPITNTKLKDEITFTSGSIVVKYTMIPLPNDTSEITALKVNANGEVTQMTYKEGTKQVVLDATGWGDVIPVPTPPSGD